MSRKMLWFGYLCAAIVAALCSSRSLAGDMQYRITDLGDLPGGENSSRAYALNDSGQVVGCGQAADGQHAFRWDSGVMEDLGTLGGDYSCAKSINGQSQIVGGSNRAADGISHAFLWEAGAMHDLGTLGGEESSASSINSAGVVVGYSETENNSVAFRWSDGQMDSLRPFEGSVSVSHSIGAAINNAGLVVGSFLPTGGATANGFAWAEGVLVELREPVLFGGDQIANSVNDAGMIVGRLHTVQGTEAFVWIGGEEHLLSSLGGSNSEAHFIAQDGTILGNSAGHATMWTDEIPADLNTLLDETGAGWTLSTARGANSSGQIVGAGLTPDGALHAYLLTPYFDSPTIPGDTNADDKVDLEDLNNVTGRFKTGQCGALWNRPGWLLVMVVDGGCGGKGLTGSCGGFDGRLGGFGLVFGWLGAGGRFGRF